MFIIIELQTTNGVTSNIVTTKNTKNEAMNAFHNIMAAAAVSEVEFHTGLVVDRRGQVIARECYEHISTNQ